MLVALALLVFAASYVQSVAGFALGMMTMAVAGGFGWVPIPVLAATVSLLSLVNVLISLRRPGSAIDRPMLGWLLLGQLPAIGLGVALLAVLSSGAVNVLKLLLGLFITGASASLLMRPRLLSVRTGPAATAACGALGGFVGGLFAASGPVIGWHGYRQPLSFEVIRATLLAVFGLTTLVRTLIVAIRGELTMAVWTLFALLLPMVVLGSLIGARYRPPIAEDQLKRAVFALLLAIGLWIFADSALRYLP